MDKERRAPWRRWSSLLALAALPATQAAGGSSGAGSLGPQSVVRATVDTSTRFLLTQGLAGASLRLGRPSCQAVLRDFRDASGRTLDRALAETGFTPPEYLGLVFFADGTGLANCKRDGAVAFTVPGSRVVRVCPSALRRQSHRDSALVEAVLIHEMLHTLGLPENPPTAEEISARVESRCLAR
jgi:hypothetical protein